MKLLMISMDRSAFVVGSPMYERLRILGELNPDDLFTNIVFSTRKHNCPTHISAGLNVNIYSTNSWSRWFYWLGAFKLSRLIPSFDVVTTQDPFESGITGCLIAYIKKVPLHVQIHTDMFSSNFVRHSVLNRLRVMVAPLVLRRARGIQVVSQSIKDNLLKIIKIKVSVVVMPAFTDISRLRNISLKPELVERFSSFDLKFLVVARLEREKNISLALESFSLAPVDSCLIILGEGVERKKLELQALRLGIGARVFFEGWQDPGPYYLLADLLLSPSFYEGCSLTIVEALAIGLPVLATDVGGAKESGAIVTSETYFKQALVSWIKDGEREGKLKNYPHHSLNEYLSKYRQDIVKTLSRQL